MFEVPFAVLVTIDHKAQKESGWLVFLLLKTGLKSLLLLVLSGKYERAALVIGPTGVLFQMFFFTQLLNGK